MLSLISFSASSLFCPHHIYICPFYLFLLSSAVSASQREADKSSFAEATKIMYLCSCFIYCIIKSL